MKVSIQGIEIYERDVKLRMPFRFGVVTLTEAPQAFVRARIRLENGKEAEGGSAELLAPKWFDKDPGLTNEQNFDQLRASLSQAREAYLASGENTAFGHSIDVYGPQIAIAATQGLNSLVACYGPALIDRAVLDALCRALGISFYEAIRKNTVGLTAPGWQADLMAFDMDEFLAGLKPRQTIAARHTVGLVDPITSSDVKEPVGDGLPETLDDVIQRYRHRWFKLKVGGDIAADVERLAAIASVLDQIGEPYQVTLDGNEQYADVDGIFALWKKLQAEPRLKRLISSIAFIEQPIKRSQALAGDISLLAEEKPVIIDESDDSLEAFPRARRLGYTGVSSKTCKGIYKSLLNAARCRLWNMEEGSNRYFMSGEDLTLQAGLALQQDLALVSMLGLTHVERNGHHYVNGMAGLPQEEQQAFLKSHEDLYEHSHGAVRVRIVNGDLQIRSLGVPGYASAALPDWNSMRKTP
jgi:L-alanine-DL-glutamate epimerase-like enolase superfamily enzyme